MTVKSELRQWGYYTQAKVRGKKGNGVHPCGRYNPFCTRCGSSLHLLEQCPMPKEEDQ